MDNTKVVGGWLTLPFIIGSIVGLSLAAGSWYANLTLFLTQEYNVKLNTAVKIYEIINIGVNVLPLVGALLSDSVFGSFFVINVASFASLLGLVMLGLSTMIPSLRPNPCNNNSINLSINAICDTPSIQQYTFLLVALSLTTLGFGCTRFMLSSLGAYQFNKPEHRRIFFNVYILAYEACFVISYGISLFIVQGHGKWAIGFGIGIVSNIIAIILFLLGAKYYRQIISQPNPFVGVTHALVAGTIRKIKSLQSEDSRVHNDDDYMISNLNIRSLNQAKDGHDKTLISILKQAEDLKRILKITPIWSAGIILSTVITTTNNLVASQASSMNLTISYHIKLPAESMTVFSLIATCITLAIFDSILFPLWNSITGRPLKPLQRSGIGHVFVFLGMIALAIVEIARINSIKTNNSGQIMSAYWLIIPMMLLGVGAAYYFPGGLTFHYQEFPESLKGSSTAMPSIQVVIGFYLSKGFIKVIKRKSLWLHDDINRGKLDVVYWMLGVVVATNFGYYLVCSILYEYNRQEDSNSESSMSTNNEI